MRNILTKIDEIVRRFVYWKTFFGLVLGAMIWAVSYIPSIYEYGSGAVVLAGVAAACVIALVISAVLVAWRYFNPLRPAAPSEGQKAQGSESHALTMRLNIFRFLTESPSDKGTYKLHLTLEALETVALTRITVLFNRPGGKESYQFPAYDPPHQMLLGENLDLVLIHHRPNIGTFWGDLDRATENKSLDRLTKGDHDRHTKLRLNAVGHYYCKLVVQHTGGEESLNFTVLLPSESERPCVITGGADHKDYDPNRITPASGTYL